jgi:hypothetical protein
LNRKPLTIAYNVLSGDHYQIGAAMAYDLDRSEQQDLNNLRGLGDIGAAAVAKLYGTWVLAKKFPLILRIDARQFVGGAQGAIGDVGVYMPLLAVPGRSSCSPVPPFLSPRIITCKPCTE